MSEIKAVLPGRTYVGANFCSADTEIRPAYEVWAPDVRIDFNGARTAVQEGADAAEVTAAFLESVNISPPSRQMVGACLARIAAGKCGAYPLE